MVGGDERRQCERTLCVGLPVVAMALDVAQPEMAYVLTGAADEQFSATLPAYCRGQASAGRVYSVGLAVTDEQAKWAADQTAKGAATEGGFGTLARPWPARLTSLFKARGAN